MALDIEHALKTQLLRDLSENGNDNYALWEIVEVISFGEFIDLYQRYYLSYPSKNDDFSSYLWSIKFLRNAAAHNSCLLNSLKAPYHVTIHKNKEMQFEVSKIKAISPNARERWLFNERMVKNKDYFIKNNTIVESYNFVSRAVTFFCNKYRK